MIQGPYLSVVIYWILIFLTVFVFTDAIKDNSPETKEWDVKPQSLFLRVPFVLPESVAEGVGTHHRGGGMSHSRRSPVPIPPLCSATSFIFPSMQCLLVLFVFGCVLIAWLVGWLFLS